MWRRCFPRKKSPVTTKEQLDADLKAYMKNAPLVTGHPICTIDKKKQQRKKIPVPVDSATFVFKSLITEGWCTDGEPTILNGRDHLWYTLENPDVSKNIPSCPEFDTKSEYDWKRIVIEDLVNHQKMGWMTRDQCKGTQRIWMCRKKDGTTL